LTAVLSPEYERSKFPESIIPRGKSNACGLPLDERRSITGPPGKPSPSSFATLSNASPIASSRVVPTIA
jgi:hypothetical protein